MLSQSWSDHTCVTSLPNRGNQQWFSKQAINQWCTEACNTCQSKPIKFKGSPLNSAWVGWPCGGQPDMPELRGQWPAWRKYTKILGIPDYQAYTGTIIIRKILRIDSQYCWNTMLCSKTNNNFLCIKDKSCQEIWSLHWCWFQTIFKIVYTIFYNYFD